MEIDNNIVKRMAFLSRIDVDENLDKARQDFENMISMLKKMDEVDISDVEPLISVNHSTIVCREDKVTEGGDAKAVLANAPLQEFGYFAVPKVVE